MAGVPDKADGRASRRFGLPFLSWYVLGQLLGPVALLTLLLTCVIALTQSFRLLDLVINRGQSAPTFLYLMSLYMPSLLAIILPIAFLFASLFTLTRLSGDSELVVMEAAGYSRAQLAAPVLLAAFLVMVLTWACVLWLAPAGQRTLSAKVLDINADVGGALLHEGDFTQAGQGVTIFIRAIDNDGQIHGILVHDSRDAKHPITYLAERGLLTQTQTGARLVMFDANVEQSSKGGAQLSTVTFESWAVSLDQFSGVVRPSAPKTSERYLNELLWPQDRNLSPRLRNAYLAEAHSRLSQPLYCLTFAMIALAAISRGRRQRGALALRLSLAALAAALFRIAGYGLAGPAATQPVLDILFYAIPLLGAAGALAVMKGYGPEHWFSRAQSGAAA
jgi:lipopolysaccharide export system permease protein